MKARIPLPRRAKRLRRQSAKRRKEAQQRHAVLEFVANRDGTTCWAQRVWPHICYGTLDGHELRSRAQYPGGHLDPDNVRLLCRHAHSFVTDHPVWAFRLGLIKSAKLASARLADAEREWHEARAAHEMGRPE